MEGEVTKEQKKQSMTASSEGTTPPPVEEMEEQKPLIETATEIPQSQPEKPIATNEQEIEKQVLQENDKQEQELLHPIDQETEDYVHIDKQEIEKSLIIESQIALTDTPTVNSAEIHENPENSSPSEILSSNSSSMNDSPSVTDSKVVFSPEMAKTLINLNESHFMIPAQNIESTTNHEQSTTNQESNSPKNESNDNLSNASDSYEKSRGLLDSIYTFFGKKPENKPKEEISLISPKKATETTTITTANTQQNNISASASPNSEISSNSDSSETHNNKGRGWGLFSWTRTSSSPQIKPETPSNSEKTEESQEIGEHSNNSFPNENGTFVAGESVYQIPTAANGTMEEDLEDDDIVNSTPSKPGEMSFSFA